MMEWLQVSQVTCLMDLTSVRLHAVLPSCLRRQDGGDSAGGPGKRPRTRESQPLEAASLCEQQRWRCGRIPCPEPDRDFGEILRSGVSTYHETSSKCRQRRQHDARAEWNGQFIRRTTLMTECCSN